MVEDWENGEAIAASGLGTSLALRFGIDVHISGSAETGDHLFLGVFGGVDYNRFEEDDEVYSDLGKKVAISLTYVL